MFPSIFDIGRTMAEDKDKRQNTERKSEDVHKRTKGNEEKDSTDDQNKAKTFNETYWAQMMISAVAHEYNCSWDKACELTAIEFLNVFSFIMAKKNREIEIQRAELAKIRRKI